MPHLTFLSSSLNVKVFKLTDLILELNDESDLCRGAEVTNDKEAYDI